MRLHAIAHARAGDKGDTSNISVIALDPAHWELCGSDAYVWGPVTFPRKTGRTSPG